MKYVDEIFKSRLMAQWGSIVTEAGFGSSPQSL